MRNRTELSTILRTILGSTNVYFQPPENIKINYPAIVYKLSDIVAIDADDKPYLLPRQYMVTLIHKDPDNNIVDKIAALPMCKLSNAYQADNLNHYVFKLFY